MQTFPVYELLLQMVLSFSLAGDEYLIHGEPRNLSFLPSSIRSTMCKQNPGTLVVAEKPNSRNNSHLLSSLAVRQPAQMKSHLCNESRKVNIESACSHSEHGMRLGISHHEQLQLSNAQFIGDQDSLAVENEQLLVKYDRVKNSHLVIEAGNQNLVDHRVDLLAVRSHAPITEPSQLTGSQVDFREQNNLGEDYKGDQAHKSVGYCDVHPSLLSGSLSQVHQLASFPLVLIHGRLFYVNVVHAEIWLCRNKERLQYPLTKNLKMSFASV